jgi:hypothetical protein
MFRLLTGIVVGIVLYQWWVQSSLSHHMPAVLQETGEVVKELGEEAQAAAKIEKNSLRDKMERIKNAATG